ENGVTTTYEYDSNGNLTKMIAAQGRTDERMTEYTYDAFGNMLTEKQVGDTDTAESITTYTYDNYGNVLTRKDALNNVYTFTYDVMGNTLTGSNPRTHKWLYTYDAAGNLLTTTNPFNKIASNEYNKLGERIKKVDVKNRPTIYGYDNRGNILTTTDALINTAITVYNAFNQPVKAIDAESKVVIINEYDRFDRPIKNIDGNGNETTREYDDTVGGGKNIIMNTSRVNYPTYSRQFNYDKRGRVSIDTLLLDDDAQVMRYTYDPVGNIVGTINRNGKNTNFEVDAYGNQTKITDALNNSTEFKYDDQGNLIALTDANLNTHRFKYDALGRLINETRPMGQTLLYDYDSTGNLIRKTTPKQQKIEYEYDALNRQTVEKHFDKINDVTPVKTITTSYDEVGNLVAWDDGSTSGANTFDALDRLLTQTISYGSFSLSYRYSYYKNGLIKTFSGPDNITYSYAYDNARQLVSVSLPSHGAITTNHFKWWAPTKITLPGGTTRETTYNGLLNAENINVKDPATNTVAELQYSYDKMQQVQTKNTDKGNYSFTYDDVYRLTEAAQTAQPDEVFTVDALGNRIKEGTSNSWVYNGNNQLTSRDGFTYEYDTNGNLITNTNTTTNEIKKYSYDILDRLIQVEDGAGNVIARYGYDASNKRLWKDVGGVKTYFLYSKEGLVGEFDESGNQLVSYGYEPGSFWTTNPLFMKTGGHYYYYQNDNVGTPYKLTSNAGAVAWEAYYKSFGGVILEPGNTITNNLHFPGQYYDTETGLHYNYHRYYDPSTGRYITSDPIGLQGGLNTYAYVAGNPINFIDSLGLYPDCESIILDVFNVITTRNEEQILSRDYGFSFVITRPSVGPNLDPRRPRQPPIAPGIRTEIWWALKELLAIKTFETRKTYQNLKFFCTEKLTDECGNVSEFRTNFERTELANEIERLTGERIETREQLIRLLLVF
ncbi:MAG: RHS domain-containing protein, partial [Gammaproteobacteria bacterium]|nr:RHS domain-containing protein [Gammaproteobacteria bacterium]